MLNFNLLRPTPRYPAYPPYHTGKYLEEYFYSFYLENKSKFDNTGYTLIPIFWTNLYRNQFPNNTIQEYINFLPKAKYFTVCQFDDGIQERLPENTINFVAGGNKDGIPIPLICSPIPEKYLEKKNKDIFCSFVGTYLNTEKYSCRLKLYETFNTDKEFYFSTPRPWSNVVQDNFFQEFCEITKRSNFTLCPRGYGLQSFRLYEALQLGSIPVFVYNKSFFPFSEFIKWEDFCILIHENEITDLKNILKNISLDQQQKMVLKGREIYEAYFTMKGMSYHILKTLQNYEKIFNSNC